MTLKVGQAVKIKPGVMMKNVTTFREFIVAELDGEMVRVQQSNGSSIWLLEEDLEWCV
jgi:hypothetical protein